MTEPTGERPPFYDRLDELLELIHKATDEPPAPGLVGPTTTDPGVVDMEERILAAYTVPPAQCDRIEPIKLTPWQKAYLLARYPQRGHHYRFAPELGHLAGRPIELVERVEDSDLPELRPSIQGFHPDAVIVDEVVEWMAKGGPVELDRWQADALLAQPDVAACMHPRRGWLGRLLDRMFG